MNSKRLRPNLARLDSGASNKDCSSKDLRALSFEFELDELLEKSNVLLKGHSIKVSSVFDIDTRPSFDLSYLTHRSYSGPILKRRFEKLKLNYQKMEFGSKFLEATFSEVQSNLRKDFESLNDKEKESIYLLGRKLNFLKELSEAFKVDLCQKDKTEKMDSSFLSFLSLKFPVCQKLNSDNKYCPKYYFKNWGKNKKIELSITEKFLRVCKRLFSETNCEKNWNSEDLFAMQRESIYQSTMNKYYNQYYQPIFELNRKSKKFNCKTNNEGTGKQIKINFIIDQDPRAGKVKELIEKSLTLFWKKPLLNVQAYFNGEGANSIFVRLTDSHSHYNTDEPDTVYIERSLIDNKDTFLKIFSHELGHVFGLKDCYIKTYEENKKVFTYVELDKFNLMCSLSKDAKLTKLQMSKVIKSKCWP